MFVAFTKYWQREKMLYLRDYRKIFCKLLSTNYTLHTTSGSSGVKQGAEPACKKEPILLTGLFAKFKNFSEVIHTFALQYLVSHRQQSSNYRLKYYSCLIPRTLTSCPLFWSQTLGWRDFLSCIKDGGIGFLSLCLLQMLHILSFLKGLLVFYWYS